MLQVAPSTYYAAVKWPPSSRRIEDEKLTVELRRVYDENQEVYGAEKLWTQMNREGIVVGRARVARLMMRARAWRVRSEARCGGPPCPQGAGRDRRICGRSSQSACEDL